MSQHHYGHQKKSSSRKNQKWKCHHCGKFGHIKPYCYELHGYPKSYGEFRRKQNVVKEKKNWILNNDNVAFISSLRTSSREE